MTDEWCQVKKLCRVHAQQMKLCNERTAHKVNIRDTPQQDVWRIFLYIESTR